MTFQVDGILFASDNPKDYPFVLSHWEGFRKFPQNDNEWENSTTELPCNTYVRTSLLNAGEYHKGFIGTLGPFSVRNLTICGTGQINGKRFSGLLSMKGPIRHLTAADALFPFLL